ncbi:unnamed protein product [Caenorhabditis auriculariae]|uniref:Uncharacterized protein n=1 Tax=Caenorhabditis auriculariae TaxID=2777116 RepID=A0A8S1HS98_9PELO|nr:unnamed protein product [Caenorhabditis auriculariae]
MIKRVALLLLCLFVVFSRCQEDVPEDVDPPLPVVVANETTSPAAKEAAPEVVTPLLTTPNKTAEMKADISKKEELLTGKESTFAATEALLLSTLAAETEAPEAKKEKEKEGAPEFERAEEQVEGGKGEEDPDANVDKPEKVDPPKDEADGAAKEDRETAAAGQVGGSLHEAVEEAKGNPVLETKPEGAKVDDDDIQTLEPHPQTARSSRYQKQSSELKQPPVNFDDDDSTGFMTFFLIGMFLVVGVYLVQHNKKKILGLVFEGRSGRSSSRRGNVRYKKLDQNDTPNDVIF